MKSKQLFPVVSLGLAVIVLGGCAAQPKQVFTKDGAVQGDFERDLARCDYEATAATQGTSPGFNTIFGQELDRAIRKRDLIVLCLKANNWRPV